jgi:hypothetical protein
MNLSISISETNKNCGKFVITDTSDYESDTATSTRLKLTTPEEVEYTIAIYPAPFAISDTYDLLPYLADPDFTEWTEGVYKFVFEASTDDVVYEASPDYYFLNDCKAKKSWANLFESTLEQYASDVKKDKVSTIRELIQASREKFVRFEFKEADRMIRLAYDLAEDKCVNC